MAKTVSRARFMKGPSASRTKKILEARSSRSKKAGMILRKSNKSASMKCPKGMKMRVPTMRKAYTKKSGVHVPGSVIAPTCIKIRGKSSGKKLIILDPEDHYLSEFGYHDVINMTKEQRMDSLKRLMAHFTPIKGETATMTYIIRALNARYVLNRNTNPKIAKIFKADQKEVSKMYAKMKA